ncbi:N-acetylmuramidase [Polaribacter sejongensis]|uniref:Peptidoglycan hydrolase n=1 Tax=Polaribacter sejongensis TaxID=985043 RepID=A0AAJ1QXT4_9FLAO|nr:MULTISPECIES: glucosaminidase domain-containing protein [Polaribacter]AUC20880.1 N-acetylmuramidase [Polaribacter sejongensis]MDN3619787.1 glucosaminidase domain-containing protein [Polaribacter undariae]UWD31552.1 glucosaminidase domain-containing protein [Polaribacter undariae]
MKLRVVLFCVSLLILSSCGSSKKASRTKRDAGVVLNESKPVKTPTSSEVERTTNLITKNSNLNKQTLDYIREYAAVSVKEMHLHRIPASITLAQGILESGRGRSELALKSNNHFGIKCHSEWQGQRVYHDDDHKGECFRKYQYVESSYDDHSAFLTQRRRYAFLFDYHSDDYKGWAKGLRRAGYATDRQYPNKLIKIIEDYRLHEFDKIKSNGFNVDRKNTKVVIEDKGLQKTISKYYEVKKGDTLYSISRKFKISVEVLKEINGLKDNTISIGQHLLTR